MAREGTQTPPWLAEAWLFMHSSWAALHQISLLGLCRQRLPALCIALMQASTLHDADISKSPCNPLSQPCWLAEQALVKTFASDRKVIRGQT